MPVPVLLRLVGAGPEAPPSCLAAGLALALTAPEHDVSV
jgi:hypothetical protein